MVTAKSAAFISGCLSSRENAAEAIHHIASDTIGRNLPDLFQDDEVGPHKGLTDSEAH